MPTRFCPVDRGGCGGLLRRTNHGGYACSNDPCPVYSVRFDNKGNVVDVKYQGFYVIIGGGNFTKTELLSSFPFIKQKEDSV